MKKSFGETLKELRNSAEVGLTRLADMINTSKGYLSDVENDKVPPLSIDKIESIANALKCEIWPLIQAARKEIEYISRQPGAADFLRKTADFTHEDWNKAQQLIDIAGLGKGGKKRG